MTDEKIEKKFEEASKNYLIGIVFDECDADNKNNKFYVVFSDNNRYMKENAIFSSDNFDEAYKHILKYKKLIMI